MNNAATIRSWGCPTTQDYFPHADVSKTMSIFDKPQQPIDDDSEAERTKRFMSSAMIPKKTRSMGQWHSEEIAYLISAQSHKRMRMREPKWAHKSAQNRSKEIDDWFSDDYITYYLHKFLFLLCKWYIFCAILIICARFVQPRARFVQKARFLCITEKPVFTGIPVILCTLVQCCAPSVSRAHAKGSNIYLINEPQTFHNGRDSCRKLLLSILNYVLLEYLTFL